ncbi:hypothetical protein PG996_016003 [Apiospora saccharicola]|uniref:Uncharacterized protein n=1 Tax=Apiospora saccharicola TaxID=335842 RepID=A0ABR1TMQ1_9PEZI
MHGSQGGRPERAAGRRNEKEQCLNEHAITEIESIQSNYEKMTRKWIESEKQRLALRRRVQDLEAQEKQRPSPEAVGRGIRQHQKYRRAESHRGLERESQSLSPTPSDILSSIESDDGSVDGRYYDDTRSSNSDSGSDGYQGDSEARPRRAKIRYRPVPQAKDSKRPRALSPKLLASLSRARARRRSAQWVRRQRKEEQRRRKGKGTRYSPEYISDSSSISSAASSQGSIPASVIAARGSSSPHSRVPRRSRTPNIERLPAETARQIQPRMFIPSRDGLAFLWESMSIAQHAFYNAALEQWPGWTRNHFPQGAHEVSFSAADLQGYFDGYEDVGEDFALRGARSGEVYAALTKMADLRNRTCHFPPRTDAHYRRKTGQITEADEMRDAIGRLVGASPLQPDSAEWYREATKPACDLASVLRDDEAMAALDDLYDRVENRAWEMLRAVEEIAVVRWWEDQPSEKDEDRRREMDQSRLRDLMRDLPEELHVPLRLFFETVGLGEQGWPDLVRRAARAWRETEGEVYTG